MSIKLTVYADIFVDHTPHIFRYERYGMTEELLLQLASSSPRSSTLASYEIHKSDLLKLRDFINAYLDDAHDDS